jgi:hypothetical protein
MAKLLKVKAGDKIVYADCKENKPLVDDRGIVIGKIYTVEEDMSGDFYVNTASGRCYGNIYDNWAGIGKATKIVD